MGAVELCVFRLPICFWAVGAAAKDKFMPVPVDAEPSMSWSSDGTAHITISMIGDPLIPTGKSLVRPLHLLFTPAVAVALLPEASAGHLRPGRRQWVSQRTGEVTELLRWR